MHPKQSKKAKRPTSAQRAFPWRCRHCGKREVALAKTDYAAEVRHDGRLHSFTIPDLELPICQACGERVFTENVDGQVNDALRAHLGLLTPVQIREAIKRVGMSQKDLAKCLGIAEATLSRWLSETQIQSRAMDNFLRAFFAFPQIRTALRGETQDPELGLSDVPLGGDLRVAKNRKRRQGDSATGKLSAEEKARLADLLEDLKEHARSFQIANDCL